MQAVNFCTYLLRLSSKLPLHQLAHIQVKEVKKHTGRGRPSKDASPTFYYQVDATLEPKEIAIAIEIKRAGRFILATNVLNVEELSDDDVLRKYKAQQSTERGFRFLKEPLFFTSSVFLNSPQRVAALAVSRAGVEAEAKPQKSGKTHCHYWRTRGGENNAVAANSPMGVGGDGTVGGNLGVFG